MFNVTIQNISDAKLGEVIASIGTKKYPVRVTHFLHPDQVDIPDPKKEYAKPMDIMSLTGKGAGKGSKRAAALVVLEKLEKKHGIGRVTRKMLREELSALGHNDQILYQLTRDGFLKYRSAE